ncbi:hypothetical protein WUBG_06493 [Wuchereria bancrofti]|uniref:Uncharacterized protein n=1 Tax=Wuchereria bancrofti TaxID=6293 RepID=J9EZH4_WUCBA|nr:hypothetical protein WUBG_06493 [Wuchereria bancrofti]
MQRERKIDVTPSNYSVLDTEFGSMRERFEAEMRHVEEEMKRLRREFEGYSSIIESFEHKLRFS